MRLRKIWPWLVLLIAVLSILYIKFPGLIGEMNNYRPGSIHSECVKKADSFALKGAQHLADSKYGRAVLYYSGAVTLLPQAKLTSFRKKAYRSQLKRAWEEFRR